MNELDQFIKHKLKIRHYFRYCDDFIIVHSNSGYLQEKLAEIANFISIHLSLELHPNKIEIRKFRQGIDFLGYVILPYYKVLRTKTKRRIFKKLSGKYKAVKTGELPPEKFKQSIQLYLGILRYCNGWKIEQKIKKFDKI